MRLALSSVIVVTFTTEGWNLYPLLKDTLSGFALVAGLRHNTTVGPKRRSSSNKQGTGTLEHITVILDTLSPLFFSLPRE
jgi:hypothetical protein